MNQEIVKSAIKTNLDTFDSFFKWFLSISVVIWWAGLSSDVNTIDILGLKVARDRSFVLVGVFFIIINVVFLLKLQQLNTLIRETAKEHLEANLTMILTHVWVLNPFGLKMEEKKSGLTGIIQKSALVIIWWLCNMSLYSLSLPDIHSELKFPPVASVVITLFFLIVGLTSLNQISVVGRTMRHKSVLLEDIALKEKVQQVESSLKSALLVGILTGFLITAAITFQLYVK